MVAAIDLAVFGRVSAGERAAAVDAFCRATLGAGVAAVLLQESSVGSVHGLRLDDGRRVVVKAHRRSISEAFLRAVQDVQRALAGGGFPAPVPLGGPAPLAHGVAVAEAWLDDGDPPDAHDAAQRAAMAAALVDLVTRCRPAGAPPGLGRGPMAAAPGALWPTPHDARFDFARTAAGAGWIDDAARRARAVLDAHRGGELVIGHADWRAEHVRFRDGELTAVHDWDSLALLHEPVLAGTVAHAFTADWRRDAPQLPTLGESLAFLDAYDAARASRFTAVERRVAHAALAYAMAYTARCEHSDEQTGAVIPANAEARSFLRAHAGELLG